MNQPTYPSQERALTVGEWMLTLFVLTVPLVNLIMYLVWAMGSGGNLGRRNFCRASIFWFLIVVAVYLAITLIVGGTGMMMNR